jgi:hypothetical protein
VTGMEIPDTWNISVGLSNKLFHIILLIANVFACLMASRLVYRLLTVCKDQD